MEALHAGCGKTADSHDGACRRLCTGRRSGRLIPKDTNDLRPMIPHFTKKSITD